MAERARAQGVLERFAILGLLAMTLAVSFRRIASNDLGYHLAYGESLLAHGRLVDHDPSIYTLPGPEECARFPPGPACWYDADGNYRFPNANWLSQALLWLAFSCGGAFGLTMLVAALLLAIVALHYFGLRRRGLSPITSFAIVSLLLLMLQFRLEPRPELFGYVVLSAQLHLLLATTDRADGLSVGSFAALVVLQVLLVNLHSYFLLGIAISGCVFAADLLGCFVRSNLAARRLGLLALLVLAQIAASFVNPWGWRLAVLPIQTLEYLWANHVTDASHLPHHPWTIIEEFHALPMPWQSGSEPPSLILFHGMVAFAMAAGVTALIRRRVDQVLLLLTMIAAALSMRRNVPTAALVLLPVSALATAPVARRLVERASARHPRGLRLASLATVVACSAAVVSWVATGRWYELLEMPAVTGVGFSAFQMPVRVARWLDEQAPTMRLWTDFNTSSNLRFFCSCRPAVPILTNTWAYPPETMREVLETLAGLRELDTDRFGIEVVAAETDSTAAPLIRRLARSPDWTLAHVEPRYAVLVRNVGPSVALAHSAALQEERFDLATWLREWPTNEVPRPALLRASARTFREVGWPSTAIRCLEEVVEIDPESPQPWSDLGALHATRAQDRLRAGSTRQARDDFEAARRAIDRAESLRPGAAMDLQNHALVERALLQIDEAGEASRR